MRRLTIVAAFLAMLFAGCGADTATGGTHPEETTTNTATGSTRPETTTGTAAAPEKTAPVEKTAPAENTAPATVAPASAPPTPVVRVSAIGDSVMKGAVYALQQEIPNLGTIDVEGSLQAPGAIDILRQRRAAGQLGDVVVVHIGNNGPFTAEMFDEMMQVLAGVRKVLVVNMTIPSSVPDPIAVPNNAMLAEEVRRYPNTVLVDWRAASANHPEFFWENDIHLTPQGAQAYADLSPHPSQTRKTRPMC